MERDILTFCRKEPVAFAFYNREQLDLICKAFGEGAVMQDEICQKATDGFVIFCRNRMAAHQRITLYLPHPKVMDFDRLYRWLHKVGYAVLNAAELVFLLHDNTSMVDLVMKPNGE